MVQYRYTLFAASLGLVLLLPPVVRSLDRSWEPFPAVLLPGEGSVESVNRSEVVTDVLRLYGRRAGSDQLVAIAADDLLHPIPGVRLGPMYHSGLFDSLPRGALREERAIWLGERLERLGLSPDSLLIRSEAITVPENEQDPPMVTVTKVYWFAVD